MINERDGKKVESMQSLVNFRDLGGMSTSQSRVTRPHAMYRSGEITSLTPDDYRDFQTRYGIQRIFDFRGDGERRQRPNMSFPHVKTFAIDISKDSGDHSGSLESLVSSRENAENYMYQLYRDFVTTESARKGYAAFLTEIAQDTQPFIFHCFAGKDRTGFAAMLLLSLLEVDEEQIMSDYLETNRLRAAANQQMIEEMAKNGASLEQQAGVKTMLEVKADYLYTSLEEINKQYGDVMGYVEKGLGLSYKLVEKLQNDYTE